MAMARRIGRSEIERPEVHRIHGRSVDRVEDDAKETLLRDILAAKIDVDRTVGERGAGNKGSPFVIAGVQSHARARTIDNPLRRAIHERESVSIRQSREVRLYPARLRLCDIAQRV